MSDRFAYTFTIGGQIDRAILPELCDQLDDVNEGPENPADFESYVGTVEWNIYEGNEPFDSLAAFCREHAIPYQERIEPKYEYDGQLTVWLPSWEDPKVYDANALGEAHFTAGAIMDWIDKKEWGLDDIKSFVSFAMTPIPSLELVGEKPAEPEPEPELLEYTVVGYYYDNEQRFGTHVMAKDADHAEALAKEEADSGMMVAAVIAGHVTILQ